LAVVGAALLAAAVPARSWWQSAAGDLHYRFGLSAAEICRGSECHARPLAQLGVDPTWGQTALAALAALIATAVVLLAMALTFRASGWKRYLGWVSAVMVLFAAALVVVVHLQQPFEGVAPGWPLFAAFLGLASGLLAAGLRSAPASDPAR